MSLAEKKGRILQPDRRKDPRYKINSIARVQCQTGALPRDCLVTDISEGGVRLHAEGLDVPSRFILFLAGLSGGRRECNVIWRLGHEIGAEFADRGAGDAISSQFARRQT